MSEKWYMVNNFDEFIDAARLLVFNSFGKDVSGQETEDIDALINYSKSEDKEELDRSLSHDECAIIAKTILKTKQNKYTNEVNYFINDSKFIELIELLNDRMVSNVLNQLSNMGLVESAYDSDADDFIFWIKDEHKQEIKKLIEKPETD
jgi:hypothetical protein